jgi:hypothetical protein
LGAKVFVEGQNAGHPIQLEIARNVGVNGSTE